MAQKAYPSEFKTHRVYTVWEAAEACGVHRQTVIRWIKTKGLRADTSRKPWLIEGADLKEFLGQQRAKTRCKLELRHCYCLGCKAPREPDGKIADYVQQTPTTGMLTGLCPSCGKIMNKVIRRADLEAIRARIEVTIQRADARLLSRSDAPLNVNLKKESQPHGTAQSR